MHYETSAGNGSEVVKCTVCHGVADVRVLPCGHALCMVCLTKVRNVGSVREYIHPRCPICNTIIRGDEPINYH